MARKTGRLVVVGYDGSEESRTAVAVAARRAGAGGRVCVVHAYQPGGGASDVITGRPGHQAQRAREQALLDAILLVGDAELLDTDYEAELIEGPPAGAIATAARERHADEIVVGARGVGRMHALLGSVTQDLIQLADRPVVVIPSRAVPLVQRQLAAGVAHHAEYPSSGEVRLPSDGSRGEGT